MYTKYASMMGICAFFASTVMAEEKVSLPTPPLAKVEFKKEAVGIPAGEDKKAEHSGTIKITVSNIKGDEGNIILSFWKNEKDYIAFGTQFANLVVSQPAKKGSVVFEITGVPAGENFAVMAFHDRDIDKKLDYNWKSIPLEPYAFGNNAKPAYGIPTFKQVAIKVEKDKVLDMDLKLYN